MVRGPRTSGVGCPLNSTYSSIRAPRQGQPSPERIGLGIQATAAKRRRFEPSSSPSASSAEGVHSLPELVGNYSIARGNHASIDLGGVEWARN